MQSMKRFEERAQEAEQHASLVRNLILTQDVEGSTAAD